MKLLGKIPNKVGLAFSGGIDSVFAFDFLRRSKKVTLVHVVHDNEFAARELEFTQNLATSTDTDLIIRRITGTKRKCSLEQFWREQRYSFFHDIPMPIITAHHLDDAVETYIMTCLHGQGRVIPYSNGNVIRPFLLVPKQDIVKWVTEKKLSFLNDPTNKDVSIPRNRVRHNLMKDILHINAGIHKVVSKKVLNRYSEQQAKVTFCEGELNSKKIM